MFSGKGAIPEIYKQCYIMVIWISEMIPFFRKERWMEN